MTGRFLSDSRKWMRRIGWLILIWATSVAALGAVALVLRAIMSAACMTVRLHDDATRRFLERRRDARDGG